MSRSAVVRAAIALAVLSSAATAKADVLSFSGSLTGLGVAGPDASCAPFPFRGTVSPSTTTGISSLGSFTYSHSICLFGASGASQGSFIMDFGQDSFEGSLAGMATPSATPGISELLFTYTILQGTGRFLDATGSFTGTGTSDARTRPSQLTLELDGSINAPAVPEPGTWGLMLIGFGITGMLIRRRRGGMGPRVPASS